MQRCLAPLADLTEVSQSESGLQLGETPDQAIEFGLLIQTLELQDFGSRHKLC